MNEAWVSLGETSLGLMKRQMNTKTKLNYTFDLTVILLYTQQEKTRHSLLVLFFRTSIYKLND